MQLLKTPLNPRLGQIWYGAFVFLFCLLFPASQRLEAQESVPREVPADVLRCTTPLERDGKARERFEELNRRVREMGKKAQIIFVGDSITQGWEGNGRMIWRKYYEPRGALNLGISSDHTQHVLWRLQHGNLESLRPKVAVVLIGVNNIPDEKNSGAAVIAGVEAVVQQLRARVPEAKILLLGIFPLREEINPQRGKALQVNQVLRGFADDQSVYFLDLGHLLVEKDGKISKEIMRDFLHPTEKGYGIWAQAMEPLLARLLGDKPVQP